MTVPLEVPVRLLDPSFDGYASMPRDVFCPHCQDVHCCLVTIIHGRVTAECAVWGASFAPAVRPV